MIPVLDIIRLEENVTYGTFGMFRIQKELFCNTLEPPDLENLVNKSSIPAQQYECIRVISPTFGETFQIMDVPGRTDVLFHPGNRVLNTEGCVLLAEKLRKLKGDRAILNSGVTFKRFMEIMEGYHEAILTIYECY